MPTNEKAFPNQRLLRLEFGVFGKAESKRLTPHTHVGTPSLFSRSYLGTPSLLSRSALYTSPKGEYLVSPKGNISSRTPPTCCAAPPALIARLHQVNSSRTGTSPTFP